MDTQKVIRAIRALAEEGLLPEDAKQMMQAYQLGTGHRVHPTLILLNQAGASDARKAEDKARAELLSREQVPAAETMHRIQQKAEEVAEEMRLSQETEDVVR